LEARLSRYPAFLGLAERPEFQDLGTDMQFAELRQKQSSISDLINYPKIQAMLQNADLLKTIKEAVVPNLGDLQAFLTNGVSQKFNEAVLGRWDFDLSGSMMLVRKAKPNLSAKDFQATRRSMAAIFAKTTFVATTEQQAFLKGLPRPSNPGQPADLQTLQGQWKGADGSYVLSMNSDGKPQEMTAHVQGDRLTISGTGTELAFVREN
jgi:hypothetical protein